MAFSASHIVSIVALCTLFSIAYGASNSNCGGDMISKMAADADRYKNCGALGESALIPVKDQCNCTSLYKGMEKCFKDAGFPNQFKEVFAVCPGNGATSLSVTLSIILSVFALSLYRAIV